MSTVAFTGNILSKLPHLDYSSIFSIITSYSSKLKPLRAFNSFDALIIDEAHRLNEKSGLFNNLGENQIKEIINAAKCSIFFIDEDQRVTLNDIGKKQAIWKSSIYKIHSRRIIELEIIEVSIFVKLGAFKKNIFMY